MINFQLMKHQSHAVELAKDKDNFYLFHGLGSGKTCTSLQLLRYKCFKENRLLRTLVCCPLSVTVNWSREVEKFTKIPSDSVHYLKGTGKKRENQLAKTIYNPKTNANDNHGIIILNYDVLASNTILEMLLDWKPEFLICDEAHLLKNYKSIRAKNCYKISKLTKTRIMLSGTPVLNTPMDLFMPYLIKDHGKSFGTNYFTFRASYFIDQNASWASKDNHFPKFVINPRREKELNEIIYQTADRVETTSCIDLPPLVKTIRYVELSEEQKKAYAQMKKDFIAFVEQENDKPKAVVAQLAVTKALRLQQIVAGSVTADDGTMITFKDTPRIKELESLLEEITPNNKVIIWSVFKADYKAIASVCDKFGLKYGMITGEQSASEKQKSIDQFQEDPECKVIIANQASGGTGLNLTAASYMIYFSKNFSLAQDLQSEARNYRNGSQIHKSITRIDLVAPETIDELVIKALQDKSEMAERILSKDFKESL